MDGDARCVTKTDFSNEFAKGQSKSALESSWNRVTHAVCAVMGCLNHEVEHGAAELKLSAESTPKPQRTDGLGEGFETELFQTRRETEAKVRIGDLVARLLLEDRLKGKTIFLGSGSTSFHVGLKMCKDARVYPQRFVTVNVPLAALWCQSDHKPVNQVSIPGALLNTRTSRFATMPGPGWPLTVSIVAADGCFYDDDKNEVVLYGNEESVATNTNLFVQNTRHSVLVCLTSSKINMGFAENPNTGPPISPPKKGVIRVLVTDEIDDDAVATFRKDGWMIVTKAADWTPVLQKMEQGENTRRRSRTGIPLLAPAEPQLSEAHSQFKPSGTEK